MNRSGIYDYSFNSMEREAIFSRRLNPGQRESRVSFARMRFATCAKRQTVFRAENINSDNDSASYIICWFISDARRVNDWSRKVYTRGECVEQLAVVLLGVL